ncbi:ATP-binding cassette domain-containing protein [Kocuria palustris]|uniref:ATP-binding cassette domain-containing protein n=1 Tax=Kocuria palustris TaxID=71999 RepID=UPI00195D5082|nr:molybdate transport system ATP-binding protein [Kocuria palustris]
MSLRVQFALAQRGLDVAFEVADGETVALRGPNGSGKSTILEVVAGLLVPDRGSLELGGRRLMDLRGRGLWVPPHRRRITLMAQHPLLLPHLDVLDNVAFGPRSAGASRAESRRRARRWLEATGTEQFARRRAHELSGGQSQRVALARALAAEPEVLLLDEPLAAVDAEGSQDLRELLARLLEVRTAVVVTHDPDDARALADRTLHLEAGRIR